MGESFRDFGTAHATSTIEPRDFFIYTVYSRHNCEAYILQYNVSSLISGFVFAVSICLIISTCWFSGFSFSKSANFTRFRFFSSSMLLQRWYWTFKIVGGSRKSLYLHDHDKWHYYVFITKFYLYIYVIISKYLHWADFVCFRYVRV